MHYMFLFNTVYPMLFQYVINIKSCLGDILHYHCLYLVFKKFVFYSTSQFRTTTFQVLSSHIWVVAIVLVKF